MNPFDLTGPDFLKLYLALLLVGVIVAFVVRWWMRQPGDEAAIKSLDLSSYEVAYLADGERRAIDAAIVNLIRAEVLTIDESTGRLQRRREVISGKAHPLEKAAFEACDPELGSLLHVVRPRASKTAEGLRDRLTERGLLVSSEMASYVQLVSAGLILAVALFGLTKVFIGLGRHRPVLFLVLLVVLTVGVAVVFFVMRPFRSRRGDRALEQLKKENAALAYAGPRAKGIADTDLALAIGLFGLGVLAGGALARLPASLMIGPPAPAHGSGASTSWYSCSSSTSSSCGGGGGCGGGCGGGGCGGCGG